MSMLNPCPICGSEAESNISFGTAQINCKNHDCIMIGCIMMNEPFVDEIEKKWNDSYSNQQLAKLKCVNDKYLDIIQAKNMNESFLESEIVSLKKQLEKANEIIRHVVYDRSDSSGLAYEYLEENDLLK